LRFIVAERVRCEERKRNEELRIRNDTTGVNLIFKRGSRGGAEDTESAKVKREE